MQVPKSENQKLANLTTDSSNSRSPVHFLNLSIDKIRIVGDLDPAIIEFIYREKPPEMIFSYEDQVSGRFQGYIQTKDDSSTLNFEFNPARAHYLDASSFWVEWNPNKISQETVEIMDTYLMTYVKKAHITRLDLAFDFEADLSEAYLLRKSKSKAGVWFGTDGSIETRYFGSAKSDKHIKIYNKKIELAEKQGIEIAQEHLWRIEVTLKGKKLRELDKMFDNLELCLPDLSLTENIREESMIYFLLHNEHKWKDLAKASRAKYRKRIKEISPVNLTEIMQQEFEKKRDNLIAKANNYLEAAQTAEIIPERKIIDWSEQFE